MDRPFIGKGFYNIITNTASPLPLAIQRFNQRASEVQIQIEVKPPLELEQSVLHGQLHAAIGPTHCLYRVSIIIFFLKKNSICTALITILFRV